MKERTVECEKCKIVFDHSCLCHDCRPKKNIFQEIKDSPGKFMLDVIMVVALLALALHIGSLKDEMQERCNEMIIDHLPSDAYVIHDDGSVSLVPMSDRNAIVNIEKGWLSDGEA